LRDALPTLGAQRIAAEAAFLPQEPGEEIDRDAVLSGSGFDHRAELFLGLRHGLAVRFGRGPAWCLGSGISGQQHR
jgi:hypothetical protein